MCMVQQGAVVVESQMKCREANIFYKQWAVGRSTRVRRGKVVCEGLYEKRVDGD